MDAEDFYKGLSDRTLKYGERPLDPRRRVVISMAPEYADTHAGQVAAVVLASLLSRMVRRVRLAFDDVSFDPAFPAPLKGSVQSYILTHMRAVAPPGDFSVGAAEEGDYIITLGRSGGPWVAHGSDWSAYVGPEPSPLPEPTHPNIFGAALGAITAAALVFGERFPETVRERTANLFSYANSAIQALPPPTNVNIGELWFVGVGSVGSSAAYFLAMTGLKFSGILFDMDKVKVENLDRSPIFEFQHCQGTDKVTAVASFLREFGIVIRPEPHALNESSKWLTRQAGHPDLMISAANERNVRFQIETQCPPIQIYGTTSGSWSSTMIRHVPPFDACSCCLFPPSEAVTECAKGLAPSPDDPSVQVDASLPFLSFAAGLFAAAEIAKLPMEDYPFTVNRAFYQPLAEEIFLARAVPYRFNCVCGPDKRDREVHARVVAGTRYERLYGFERWA